MNTIAQALLGQAGQDAQSAGWRIALASDYNNYVKFALFLVCAAMIYLTVRSYLREGDHKPSIKLGLAAIRMAVIILVFLIIFRPAIVLRSTWTLYSNALVLLDDSMSMGFKDRYADPEDAKKLAAALGVREAELRNLTRMDIMKKLMEPVMVKLAKDHPEEIWRFGVVGEKYTERMGPPIEDVLSIDKKALNQPTSAPANIGKYLLALTAKGLETNIPSAIRASIDALQGKRACIVLVSDGRMTAENISSRMSAVRDYATQRGIAIYTVTVGDKVPPKSINVAGLQAPRDVRKDASITFIAKLTQRGMTGQSVNLKLQCRKADEDAKAFTDVKTQAVKLEGVEGQNGEASHGDQQVEMTVEAQKEGDYVYRVIVDYPSEDLAAEPQPAEISLKVSDKQLRVLLVSGDAGHEFQYLKNYFLSQPEIYKLSVWQENADPEVNQASSTGMKLTSFPNSREAIMGSAIGATDGVPTTQDSGAGPGKYPGYDVVILYDPQPTAGGFDKTFCANLKEAVDLHGLGLCYIAGNKYSVTTLATNNEDYKPLRDMMPVQLSPREVPDLVSDKKPEPFQMRITGYGFDHPIMRLGASTEDTAKIWENMPGIFWSHQLLRIKPTARVLAENSNDMRRLDRNIAEPLIVAMPVGRGRVLYMNTDETWRWRFLEDAKEYRLFWSNVAKYLTPTNARNVIISTGGDKFPAGEKITVEVEAYDSDWKELKDPSYKIVMIDKATGDKHDITLEAVPDKPGRYKGAIPAALTAHVGRFELTNPALKPDQIEPKELKIELPQAEAARPESDPVTMMNIASKPDFAIGIADAAKLADMVPTGKLQAFRDQHSELWDREWPLHFSILGWDATINLTILLIVMLLTIEWVLRKVYNMA